MMKPLSIWIHSSPFCKLESHSGRKRCYSFITAQIISRLVHRGSVEVERVLRRL
jgi:hypothetical protein